jgi:hypothetical protein
MLEILCRTIPEYLSETLWLPSPVFGVEFRDLEVKLRKLDVHHLVLTSCYGSQDYREVEALPLRLWLRPHSSLVLPHSPIVEDGGEEESLLVQIPPSFSSIESEIQYLSRRGKMG